MSRVEEEGAAFFLAVYTCFFMIIMLACGSFAVDRFGDFNAYQATGVE